MPQKLITKTEAKRLFEIFNRGVVPLHLWTLGKATFKHTRAIPSYCAVYKLTWRKGTPFFNDSLQAPRKVEAFFRKHKAKYLRGVVAVMDLRKARKALRDHGLIPPLESSYKCKTIKNKAALRRLILSCVDTIGALDDIEFYADFTWSRKSKNSNSFILRKCMNSFKLTPTIYEHCTDINLNISSHFREIEKTIVASKHQCYLG